MIPPLTNRELLARLVAFDTTSSRSNLPLADFIADYLDLAGVTVRRQESPDGTKANLVIRLGPDRPGPDGLILSGHMDTVPADEPDWDSDPYALTERGGRLYGRGSSDMKGFLALAVNRARILAASPALAAPLVLVLTYDEEVGTLGARHFVEQWPDAAALPRRVLVGEPTSLKAVRMHKGHTKLRFTFTGESAHSGYPHLGRNAIEPAARAVTALAGLRDDLALERPALHEHFGLVPYVALNVGCIHGGSAVNVVPDRCVVEVGFRPLPRMDHATVIDRMLAAVTPAAGDMPFTMELTGESPAMIGEATELYEGLREAVEQREEVTVSYTTDGGWFQRAGMECVIFGPGSIEVAHRPNEYLPMDDLMRADPLVEAAVHAACIVA